MTGKRFRILPALLLGALTLWVVWCASAAPDLAAAVTAVRRDAPVALLLEVGTAGNSLDEALNAARLFAEGFAETILSAA